MSDYVQQTGLELVAATWFLATNNSAVATSSSASSTLATAPIVSPNPPTRPPTEWGLTTDLMGLQPTAAAASPSA